MRTYEAIAGRLADAGVRAVFGLIGEDIAKLMIAAERAGLHFYTVRHENQAVMMADGYSRVTGTPAVAAVTGGPGFTNAMTGIGTAARHGSKVVVIVGAGDVPAKQLPVGGLCASLGVTALESSSTAEAIDNLDTALQRTIEHQLSVLTLPNGVLEAPADAASQHPWTPAPVEPVQPDPNAVGRLADFFEASFAVGKTVILAGRGAVVGDASRSLIDLGERIGALLCTTLRAPGLFSGEAFDIGYAGTYSTALGTELLHAADCVLVVGASLNRFTTYGGELFGKARVIQVDASPQALGEHLPVDTELSVVGDARLVVDQLVAELEARDVHTTGYRTEAVLSRIQAYDPYQEFSPSDHESTIDPRVLAIELDAFLPEDRVAVIDGGNHSAFWVQHLNVRAPRDFVQTSYVGGMSSIGLSMGAAIGAAIGRPDELVTVFMGDASFLMALGDLETAVRLELPLVLFISNDQALGAEAHYLEIMEMPTDIVRVPTPGFEHVARSLGAEAMTVRSLTDLDVVKQRLAQPIDRPLVIDCYVDPDVPADWLSFIFTKPS